MTGFRAGLWQMGIGDIDAPYIGLSLAAGTKAEAIALSRAWARNQDLLPQTWLQVRHKGVTFHAEHIGDDQPAPASGLA